MFDSIPETRRGLSFLSVRSSLGNVTEIWPLYLRYISGGIKGLLTTPSTSFFKAFLLSHMMTKHKIWLCFIFLGLTFSFFSQSVPELNRCQ